MDRMSRLITTDELAERWATSRNYLANLRSQGKGCPYIKLGRRILYRATDVKRYEADRRVTVEPIRSRAK